MKGLSHLEGAEFSGHWMGGASGMQNSGYGTGSEACGLEGDHEVGL
jgi:hypothetical protein